MSIIIGANINHVETDGWSALHFAALNGHTDTVVLLLRNNIDVFAETNVSTDVPHIRSRSTIFRKYLFSRTISF